MLRSGGSAEDQLAIRELIELYSDACCQRDAEQIAELWVEDGYWGVLDMPDLVGRGRDEIVERWKLGQSMFPKAIVLCLPGRIRIDGDQATCRTYTTEIVTSVDGKVRKAVGIYEDAFRKEKGRWYFARRVWSSLHEEGDYSHPE